MMDIYDPSKRTAIMGAIKSTGTAPEVALRKSAHRLGYRFRLHRRDLPGSPDLVFPKRGAAVFVHGCFWHRHPGCSRASMPKTNTEFWNRKFRRNVERDARKEAELKALGWRVLVVWECEIHAGEDLEERLHGFLSQPAGRICRAADRAPGDDVLTARSDPSTPRARVRRHDDEGLHARDVTHSALSDVGRCDAT